MVYARKVGERTVTLRVSGMLWNGSLVMEDVETGSLWSHILGKCMRGILKGSELEVMPSVMTTWVDWREKYPDATVLDLSRTAMGYDRGFYRGLDRFVLGVVVDGQARAYPFDHLQSSPIVEDRIGEESVLVVFDPPSTRAALFSRRLDGKVLDFEPAGEGGFLRDRRTGSTWDPVKGLATAGPLSGRRLAMLPAIVSYRKTWRIFHPHTVFWMPQRRGPGSARALLETFDKGFREHRGPLRPPEDPGWKLRFRTLRDLVLAGERATPDLVAALGSSSAEVRILAAQALSLVGDHRGRDALEKLSEKDSSAAARLYAVDALGAMGGTESRELLDRIGKDDRNRDVRSHVKFARERGGKKIPGTLRAAFRDFDPARIDTARIGSRAPDFTLLDHDGKEVRLSSYLGKKTVALVFIYGDT